MKTAICCYSRHHGNTRRVVESMARETGVDLIDVTARQTVCLEDYDCIGFASGIYFGKFHDRVLELAAKVLPEGRPIFLVCTYGSSQGKGPQQMESIAREKGCPVLGTFGCRGYDTFGPFKLLGGIAKGCPSERDLENARDFYREIIGRL